MPAHKKSPDRLQRRNKAEDVDGQLVALRNEQMPIPAAPKGLSESWRAEWDLLWKSELATKYVDSDLPDLRRLFTLRQRVENFEAEVFEGVEDKKAAGPLSRGSTGQLSLHPLLKQVDVYQSQIIALADRFGLNPQARLKLNIALGEADRSLDEMNKRIAAQEGGRNERPDPRLSEAIDVPSTAG